MPSRDRADETVRALLSGAGPPQQPERATQAGPSSRSSAGLQTRIPATLLHRVKDEKAKTGDTHETWFLDAFDAVYDDLAEHYRPRADRRSPVPQRRRKTARPTGEELAAYPLRLSGEEEAALRERAAQLSPPSISEFVTTIVRLRLQQLDDTNP